MLPHATRSRSMRATNKTVPASGSVAADAQAYRRRLGQRRSTTRRPQTPSSAGAPAPAAAGVSQTRWKRRRRMRTMMPHIARPRQMCATMQEAGIAAANAQVRSSEDLQTHLQTRW